MHFRFPLRLPAFGMAIAAMGLSLGTSAAEPPAVPVYRSAFEDYRGHADVPLQPWKESNELVGRIGGWRAYAREAAADRAPATAASPASAPASGHAGHRH